MAFPVYMFLIYGYLGLVEGSTAFKAFLIFSSITDWSTTIFLLRCEVLFRISRQKRFPTETTGLNHLAGWSNGSNFH